MVSFLFSFFLFISFLEGRKSQHQYFRVSPKDTETVEGQNVELHCLIGNQAGSVQWSKDGFLLEIPGYPRYTMVTDEKHGIYNLLIRDVRLDDEGEFQCQVNTVGPTDDQKPIRANARLRVLIPPRIITINNIPGDHQIEIVEGVKVTLICEARGSKPPTQLKWYWKNMEPVPEPTKESITDDGHRKFSTSSLITVHPKQEDADATYVCEAHHPALRHVLRTSVTISILFNPGPPEIEGYQEGDIIQVGDTLTLACISRGGNPPAKLMWYRDNVLVDTTYTTSGRETTNTHTFTVFATDNNAVYRCEASNSITRDSLTASVKLNVLFAPAKVTITGPPEAKRGDTVTMHCTTEPSNPPSQLSWMIDSLPVIGGETVRTATLKGWVTSSNLTITLTRQDPDVKVFSCYAECLPLRETIFQQYKLKIIYPPKPPTIIGYEEGKPLRIGDFQRFNCVTLGGNPPAVLRWLKGDREISTPLIVSGSGVSTELVIRADISDNGAVYRCEANNSATLHPVSAYIKTTVYFPPDNVTINVHPSLPRAGQMVTFTCTSGSSNPVSRITWRKNGINIRNHREETISSTHGGIATRSRLFLTVSAEDDNSTFLCQVRNDVLHHTLHDSITLRVLYGPIFPVHSKFVEIVEDESAIVNLTAKANPPTIWYTWTKKGSLVPSLMSSKQQVPMVMAERGVLYIWHAARHHAGTYVCEAENLEDVSNATVVLNVLYGANITNITSLVKANEGESVCFECVVDANPLTEDVVVWRKKDSEDILNFVVMRDRAVVTVFNVTKNDSKIYECVAYNGIGEPVVRTAQLVILYKPVILHSQIQPKVAGELKMDTRLYCFVDCSDELKFVWSFNGSVITDSNKYKIEVKREEIDVWKSVLTIKNVDYDNFGIYTCLARNSIGYDFFKIILVQKSIPDIPNNFYASEITHESVVLRWKPGFDGGYQQSFYIRYKKWNDKIWTKLNVADNLCKVKDLMPETDYVFMLSATNFMGDTEERTLNITSKSFPILNTTIDKSRTGGKKNIQLWWITAAAVGGLLVIVNILLFFCFQKRRNWNQRACAVRRESLIAGSTDKPKEVIGLQKLLSNNGRAFFFTATLSQDHITLEDFQVRDSKIVCEESTNADYARSRKGSDENPSDNEDIYIKKESSNIENVDCPDILKTYYWDLTDKEIEVSNDILSLQELDTDIHKVHNLKHHCNCSSDELLNSDEGGVKTSELLVHTQRTRSLEES
ncbi:nephrin-like isoform X3 [Centruroides vittatus]|uniref:nephrin-like isoform X3 n=1 Tax=Centruroides vittatus TaxID=120091 RepID=UPI0035103A3A